MPCFCSATTERMPQFIARARLQVQAVPPQLAQLADLLGLEDTSATLRADDALAGALPNMGAAAWIKATLRAQAPQVPLPVLMPAGAGPLVMMMARLGTVAPRFPVADPARLAAELRQAARSMSANVARALAQIRKIPHNELANITQAARLTLALRQKGLCPMALARVDMRFSASAGFIDPVQRVKLAATLSATLAAQPLRPLALSPQKLDLARAMAALAPLADLHETLGTPPLADPAFAPRAAAMLQDLARVPVPHLQAAALMDTVAKLDAVATIKAAFGEDALTEAGVMRVRAMLTYVARLRLPVSPAAIAVAKVNAQVAALPKLEDVRKGAAAIKGAAPIIAASMKMRVPNVAALAAMEALNALAAVLEKALGETPLGPCSACAFPLPEMV